MSKFKKTYTKTGALRAYDAGVPSTLPPGNHWRPHVEEHRWGGHADEPYFECPVCERDGNG